jgi:hypothetical protein
MVAFETPQRLSERDLVLSAMSNIRSNQATTIVVAANMVSGSRLTTFDALRVKTSLPALILLLDRCHERMSPGSHEFNRL